jgi:hypothetical protein
VLLLRPLRAGLRRQLLSAWLPAKAQMLSCNAGGCSELLVTVTDADAPHKACMGAQPAAEAVQLRKAAMEVYHYVCVAGAALLYCLPPGLAGTCCCAQHLGVLAN